MLNALRESSGSWIVKIFLGLLVLSFAVWGIGDIFRFQPSAAVVTVGSQEISGEEFIRRFDRELRGLQQRFGPGFDQEQARRFGLVDRVVQNMIDEAIYDQQSSELDLTATDADILWEIQQNPAFKDTFGNFSRLIFEQRLAQTRVSEPFFVDLTRRAMARNQLMVATVGTVGQPGVMADAIYRYQQEKRVLEILTIPHAAMTVLNPPTTEELQDYYSANQDDFMAPEYRTLTFLVLRPEDIAETVFIDDDAVRQAYDNRLHEFTTIENRDVEQIVLQDEETALKVVDRLKQGEDFYAVAKDLADADKEAVSLGRVVQNDLPVELAEPVFSLPVGSIGGPVSSGFGWHVFRVLEIEPGAVRSFEEMRETLLKSLQLEKAEDAAYDIANAIDDGLAGGSTLEEMAEQLNLTHGRVTAIDSSGRNRDGEPLDGLPDVPGLLVAGFAQDAGEDLALQQTTNGVYYVVRVDEIMPPAVRQLSEVRADVEAKLLQERKAEIAAAEAERILEAARAGGDLAELAQSLGGAAVATSEPMTRSQGPGTGNLSSELNENVFALPTGGVAAGEDRNGSAHMVVAVKEIQAADAAEDAPGRLQIKQFLGQSMSDDLVQQLTSALRQKYDIEINDRQIDALFDEINVRG